MAAPHRQAPRRRAGGLAALVVWTVSEVLFGVEVRQPAFGTGVPQHLTVAPIVVASVVAVGTLLIVLLARTSRPA